MTAVKWHVFDSAGEYVIWYYHGTAALHHARRIGGSATTEDTLSDDNRKAMARKKAEVAAEYMAENADANKRDRGGRTRADREPVTFKFTPPK